MNRLRPALPPLFAALLLAGCGRPAAPPADPLPAAEIWGAAPARLASVETGLSPALLVQTAGPGALDLFAGRAPGWLAWSTTAGQRATNAAVTLDGAALAEGWLLAWWAGAAGWTNGDAALAVFLGRRPRAVDFSRERLRLDFADGSGPVALLPLFGTQLLGAPGVAEVPATPGRKEPWPAPWRWTNGLPREPLTRLRYWNAATRWLPAAVATEAADGALHERFRFLGVGTDWPVTPLRLAPVRPALAGAPSIPGTLNFELPVAGGLLYAAPDADGLRLQTAGRNAAAWPTNGLALTLAQGPGRWPELRLLTGDGGTSLGEIRPGTDAAPAAVSRTNVSPVAWRTEAR
jgi:hypothetical protein